MFNKLNTYFYLSTFLMLATVPELSAQQRTWKTLRQQGANFYEIQDTFERQNATLLQAFQNADIQQEGDSAGKFNAVIKYNRWAHRIKTRVSESQGEISAITIGNARALAQRNTEIQTRTGESWQSVSPAITPTNGGNGRINAVRVHPTNPAILFACAPAGGLWKSVNGGDNWTCVSENIAILGCSDVGFSPTDPNTMYLATGDGEASDSYSTGVYKSTDGGLNWAATGLQLTVGQKEVLSRLLVNPADGSILVTGSGGIRRSTNGGATWTLVSTFDTRAMELNPNNPAIVYATRYDPIGSCFLRSTNGGATWTSISNGLPTTNIIRAAIGVTPADSNYVYLMISDNMNYGLMGIYRSTDKGLSFSQVGPTSPLNTMGWDVTGADTGGQGLYDIAIAVSPTDKNLLFTGGVNIWKSTNGGVTFNIAAHWSGDNNTPYVHADIHHLGYNGSELWVGCDGGVFKTNNQGSSWINKSSNLSIAQMYGFGQSATNPDLIVSGHQDNGTNLMVSPTQWSQVLGADGMQCFIDRNNDNNIFASVYFGRMYRSTNRGATFSRLGFLMSNNWVTPWMQDPMDANTLYAGGYDVFKYNNNLGDWRPISNFSASGQISALDVSPSNNQIIVAAAGTYAVSRRTYTPHVYRTANGGTTWTEVTGSNFPANASIIGLHIDANNPNRIYVGFASYTGNSVYISDNGGATWTNYSAGLPSIPANCFVTTSGNGNGEVFVGTDIGVYHRINSMSAWESFNHNLSSAPVSQIKIFYPTAKLRISTFGRGVWETTLPGYNAHPIVRLTAPTVGQTFVSPAMIPLAATATDADGRVTRVDFYNGNTLLATDTSAPYTYNWTNVLAGTYQLTAKATDDSAAVSTTYPFQLTVLGQNDAQLKAILEPVGMIGMDTTTVFLQLKNAGNNPLTTATIRYQLDNNAVQTYVWTGNLASMASINLRLPYIFQLSVGAHQILASVSNPNGTTDENHTNDTLIQTFRYEAFGTCADNYEPNETVATVTPIPTNITVRSMIGTANDLDAFMFKTTLQHPSFKVVLNELPANYALDVYKHDYNWNRVIYMGTSDQRGLQTDSLVFDNLADTGTYYAVVLPSDTAFSASQCYALRVHTFEQARYDMSLDSILSPQGTLFSNTFTPILKIKNRGTSNVHFLSFQSQIDNTSRILRIVFPTPLKPDSTTTILLPPITDYSIGHHSFSVLTRRPNGYLDVNPANDTFISSFRYVKLPTIALTTPVNGAIFAANATIPLSATATANNGGTITKIDFYDGNVLINTDSISPYTVNYNNMALGTHLLKAKAYDNEQNANSSPVTTVYISGANDAGVVKMLNIENFVRSNSTRPQVAIRNFGIDSLRNVQVYYQLDNSPIETQSVTGLQLASGQISNLNLSLLRYAVGVHTLKVWTMLPNALTDLNTANDTLIYSFDYQGFEICSNHSEPNDTYEQATWIPTNLTVRSMLATTGDKDFYRFQTTIQQPHFTVTLNELSQDHDIYLYKWDYANQVATAIGRATNNGLQSESILMEMSQDTGTYLVEVTFGAGGNDCYALTVRTYEPITYDLSLERILMPDRLVDTSAITPIILVRNNGNTPISIMYIRQYLDNILQGGMFYPVSPPLQPNDSLRMRLMDQSYSVGTHQFKVQGQIFGLDINPLNDTLSVEFRYVQQPKVRLVTPAPEQIYQAPANINLSAVASAENPATTITRVEFYKGDSLLATPTPYQFNWMNVPLGTYQLRAKVIDSDSVSVFSTPVTVHVTGNIDAGVIAIENALDFWQQDSVQPIIRIRNYGSQPLSSVKVSLRYDNQTIVSQLFRGANLNQGVPIRQGDAALVTLPKLLSNTVGQRSLSVWTSLPNDVTDVNNANDTLQQIMDFRDFGICSDNYEPNNNFETATKVPTDILIRSRLATVGDQDYFVFKTTVSRPHFTIVLNELRTDHNIELYRVLPNNRYIWLTSSNNPSNFTDSIRYTRNDDSATYIVAVVNNSGVVPCYALKINTIGVNHAPIAHWTTPTNGQVFGSATAFTTIPLKAIASDSDLGDRINKVEFYKDTLLLATDTIAPYQYDWTTATIGTHRLNVKAYDNAGATAEETIQIVVESRIGVGGIGRDSFQFKIHPNPTRDIFNVLLETSGIQNDGYQLIIKDVLGRFVMQQPIFIPNNKTAISIETAHWAKGMYFVSIQKDGRIVTEKVVIE
jgi:Bacterial Ig domain/Secretion system C-terminal sorting domain